MLTPKSTVGFVKKLEEKPLENDALNIGRCKKDDKTLLSCSDGCNSLDIGGTGGCGDCNAGAKASIEISCTEITCPTRNADSNGHDIQKTTYVGTWKECGK